MASPTPHAHTGATVLVVDDEELIRWSLAEHLRSEGYRVIEAENGLELLEKVADQSPDLLITDLKMPKLGGMEALRQLRERNDDLPVIVLTAHGAVDSAVLYREHAAKCGIDINVIREPSDGYWSSVWLQKPWCFSYWGGRPTEDWMFSTAYAEGAAWNETHWSHARFNQLLVEGRSELDDDKRRAIYYEMQQIVSDEGGAVVPMFNNYVNAVTTKLQIPDQVASNWNNDGHKLTERWWFKG